MRDTDERETDEREDKEEIDESEKPTIKPSTTSKTSKIDEIDEIDQSEKTKIVSESEKEESDSEKVLLKKVHCAFGSLGCRARKARRNPMSPVRLARRTHISHIDIKLHMAVR